jgi:hypothetical protein
MEVGSTLLAEVICVIRWRFNPHARYVLPDPTNVALNHDFTRVGLILYGVVKEKKDVRRA